ncbi:glycoside hydrolase family 28 protein [Halopelagius longus]|uniref:Glycoside hydrolase family 28 protein n=1 Tax=Halopelagius longus TaxID=1236180 RepID=A0A1H1G414_9EURY|nr:glycoside hydrolase family 28 protein [Halopelagius longus]RDI69863.1 glycoside hydrolase family 28 protein [Halopelagius longus]SDR07799.1 Polygalacturonase [Halopelagius longus]
MSESDTFTFDVREYGAAGDGAELDTEAIQDALDDCAETGGTVRVPPGTYRTAPLRVGDDTTLHLDAGATLRFVRDYSAFPTVESRWEGWNQVGFHPCLFVAGAENVAVTGRGTIDGQGDYWWEFYDTPESEYPDGLTERLAEFEARNDKRDDVSSFTLRPPLFQISESENVTVSGVTLRNSPFWNTHVVYSENVTLHDVNVENPEGAPNGDGIDIDSSRFVRISDTYINAGDDAICIKSGKNEEGRTVGRPAAQITVTNCTVEAGHGGVVVGSEMSGDVRDVTVSNCTFTGTDRGVRIKTQRGRGGVVEDLRFDNIVMRRVACPFVVNGYYFTDIDSDPVPVDDGTPTVRNVHFSNVTARNVSYAGFFAGLPERSFEGISFSDVRIDATRPLDATDVSPAMAENYDASHTFFCKSLGDVSFRNVEIRTPESPAMAFEEVESVELDGLRFRGEGRGSVVTVTDVGTTRVHGCRAPDTEGAFLRAYGPETRRISLSGNDAALEGRVETDDTATDVVVE